MRTVFQAALISCCLFFFTAIAFADTLYLKNGRSIEGLIKNETDESIDLDVGFGTVNFRRDFIERIEKSTPQETQSLKNKWDLKNKRLGLIKLRAEEARTKSIADWRERQAKGQKAQEEQVANEDMGTKNIGFSREAGSMSVDAVLNERVRVSLIVDTGASVILLKKDIARRLGVDLSKEKADMEIQVADGRKIKAKYVILKSVKIGDVWANNVEAAILVNNVSGVSFKDGLLGMSFLERFNFKFDYSKNRLVLERR